MTERGLTHVDATGAARMVDVSGKDVSRRTAVASGRVLVSAEVVALLRGDGVPKGTPSGSPASPASWRPSARPT
jgi:cyclic pyranopterin phosphate synthase